MLTVVRGKSRARAKSVMDPTLLMTAEKMVCGFIGLWYSP